jgi:hypothetical protein
MVLLYYNFPVLTMGIFLTCNLGYYCLSFVSVVLGAVGVLSARQAVEEKSTSETDTKRAGYEPRPK